MSVKREIIHNVFANDIVLCYNADMEFAMKELRQRMLLPMQGMRR